jgi:hypothetical protein
MKRNYKREYTYEEWERLPDNIKFKITLEYWDYKTDSGKQTRQNILDAYVNRCSIDLSRVEKIEFRYDEGVYIIAVITDDMKYKFTKSFDIFLVSKGFIRECLPNKKALVYWQDIGPTKEIITI